MKTSCLAHEYACRGSPAPATTQRKAMEQPLFKFQRGTTRVVDDTRENEGEDGDVPRALDHAGHQGKQVQLVSWFQARTSWTPVKQRPAFPAVVPASSKYVYSLFLQHLSKCLGHHKCGSMLNAFLKTGWDNIQFFKK